MQIYFSVFISFLFLLNPSLVWAFKVDSVHSKAIKQAAKYSLYIFVYNSVVNNTEHYALKCLLLLAF